MAKEGKGYNQSMFTNKDGYLKGGNVISIPPQNLIRDPRAKSSIRGSSARIATGDKVTVRSTGGKGSSTKARKQTATWF